MNNNNEGIIQQIGLSRQQHLLLIITKLRQNFKYNSHWHQEKNVRELTSRYNAHIEAILQAHPHLCSNLTKCVHCNILFFTDPRNKGRTDLRCPFGCRKEHRKRSNSRLLPEPMESVPLYC